VNGLVVLPMLNGVIRVVWTSKKNRNNPIHFDLK
jgi:hypothetical protein